MDQTSLYVPNYQKWQNFYDKIIDNDKRTDMSMVNDLFHHNSDSSKHGGNSDVSLNLVSPVKMLMEQAKMKVKGLRLIVNINLHPMTSSFRSDKVIEEARRSDLRSPAKVKG